MPLRGFLHVPRGALAFAAALVAFMFVPMQDLPASAVTVEETIVGPDAAQVDAIAIEVPEAAAVDDLSRDGYGVEVHSLVMWAIDPNTKISSYFGYRVAPCGGCSSDHQGVDYNPGMGAPIVAIADGVVVAVGNPSGELGVHAIIEHVVDGVKIRSVYGHMAFGSMDLEVGDIVARGQLLGAVGSTGQSTGPHLHFGILQTDGEAVDPIDWMQAHVNS